MRKKYKNSIDVSSVEYENLADRFLDSWTIFVELVILDDYYPVCHARVYHIPRAFKNNFQHITTEEHH